MNHRQRPLWIAVLAVTAASCSLSGQPAGERREPTPEELLKRFDQDGDGRLSRPERQAAWKELRSKGVGKRGERAALPPGVRAGRDVAYARIDGQPLLLDVYLPDKADRPLPVIVWIHGGGWRSGSKERCPAVPLAAEGYAVVSINYRLSEQAAFPAQIHDCKAAVRWVRARAKEFGFDPDRIGAWGGSAGGHLAALLGTSGGVEELEGEVGEAAGFSSRVQAVCDFCGPTHLSIEGLKDLPEAGEGKTPEAVRLLLGGSISDHLDKARLASPAAHVTPDDPPFLIVHGDADAVVPVKQSRILATELAKAGVEVTLHIVPGGGHGIGGPERFMLVKAFFDKHLKGPCSAPAPATGPATGPAR